MAFKISNLCIKIKDKPRLTHNINTVLPALAQIEY